MIFYLIVNKSVRNERIVWPFSHTTYRFYVINKTNLRFFTPFIIIRKSWNLTPQSLDANTSLGISYNSFLTFILGCRISSFSLNLSAVGSCTKMYQNYQKITSSIPPTKVWPFLTHAFFETENSPTSSRTTITKIAYMYEESVFFTS